MYFLKGEMVYKFRVLLASVLNRKKIEEKTVNFASGNTENIYFTVK